MNTTEKKKYNKPTINEIKIDYEISLVLMSANPYHDPDEPFSSVEPDRFINNPFKTFIT